VENKIETTQLSPVTPPFDPPNLAGRSLSEIERSAIAQTLTQCGGNKMRTAQVLQIALSTLYEKIKKYGL
jgi:DNA-binding NtrC family response regulator